MRNPLGQSSQASSDPTPSTSPTLIKIKPSARPRPYNTAGRNYLPVKDAELEPIIAESTTKGKEEKAMAEFQKRRSSESTFANRPYEPREDPWLTRLRRYLKFFKGRKVSSRGGKTASGWPITREKFILWAHKDPRPTIRSLTTYLQTIEAARVATHALFSNEFPGLSQQSLQLDPLVNDTIDKFARKLAQAPPPQTIDITTDPEIRSKIHKENLIHLNTSTAQDNSLTDKDSTSAAKSPLTTQANQPPQSQQPAKVSEKQSSTAIPNTQAPKGQPRLSLDKASSSTAQASSSTAKASTSTAQAGSTANTRSNAKIGPTAQSRFPIDKPSVSTTKPSATPQATTDTPHVPPKDHKNKCITIIKPRLFIAKPPTTTRTSLVPPKASKNADRLLTDAAVTSSVKNGTAVSEGTTFPAKTTAKPPTTTRTPHATTDTARALSKPSKELSTVFPAKPVSTTARYHEPAETTSPQTTPPMAIRALLKTGKDLSAAKKPEASKPDSSVKTGPSSNPVSTKRTMPSKPKSLQRVGPSKPVYTERLSSEEIVVVSRVKNSNPPASRSPSPPPPVENKTTGESPAPSVKHTRRLSDTSSDCPLALLPRRRSPRKKIKSQHLSDSTLQPAQHIPSPSIKLSDTLHLEEEEQDQKTSTSPIYQQVSVFSDIRIPEIRDQFFGALRRDHPNNLSTDEVLERFSAEMKALTGPDGELGQIGSEEDLAACLQTYLDYWASEGISGFPIEALKVIIWMDSYEPTVTEKEALDISLSFDRLCRLIATGFPQDGPGTMFDYPTSFLESPIWSSFLDHHGWPPHHPQDPSPSFPRHSSLTSLDSLHHSPPSTHEKFLRSGIDTLLVPDPLTGLYTDPNQSSDNHSEPQNYQPDLSAENYHQFRYKRDSIGSAHHQTFLSNLRRFVLLLS